MTTTETYEHDAIRHATRALEDMDGLSCRWGYTAHQMAADIRLNLAFLCVSDLNDGIFDPAALRA